MDTEQNNKKPDSAPLPSNKSHHVTGENTCAPGQFPEGELAHSLELVHEEPRYGPVRVRDDIAPPTCGCAHSDEICDCKCHIPEEHTEHVGPCCENCPNCGRRIKMGFLSLHMQSCTVEPRTLDGRGEL